MNRGHLGRIGSGLPWITATFQTMEECTMGQFLEMSLSGARRSRVYAEKLLAGIKPEQAARKPHFETGGAPLMVDTNHPVFVYGHLALYPARVMKFAGLDGAALAAP